MFDPFSGMILAKIVYLFSHELKTCSTHNYPAKLRLDPRKKVAQRVVAGLIVYHGIYHGAKNVARNVSPSAIY